jgi:hypothetical protein
MLTSALLQDAPSSLPRKQGRVQMRRFAALIED